MNIIFFILGWWFLCLFLLGVWKRELFLSTWKEPYFLDTPVLIESDDWGPGGPHHAERLKKLLECLANHRDSVGREAVLTADCVLAVPDIPAINESSRSIYRRKMLDIDFPSIHAVMKEGIKIGTMVPQLHGLEHLNSSAFLRLCHAKDPRVKDACKDDDWWDWESLDSPLQAHYVDGSCLPTRALPIKDLEMLIKEAVGQFERIFGYPSASTVAPCYLWNDDVERIWARNGIAYIQTAGYRCPSRDQEGRYIQDKKQIRIGDESTAGGQRYLVRNVMYEPADGKNTPETALNEAIAARRQALPITISTHRYNYTRSKEGFILALEGLDLLLSKIEKQFSNIRYISSPELGQSIEAPHSFIQNPFQNTRYPPIKYMKGPRKIFPYIQRLMHRHPKLLYISIASGLIVPISLLMFLLRNHK